MSHSRWDIVRQPMLSRRCRRAIEAVLLLAILGIGATTIWVSREGTTTTATDLSKARRVAVPPFVRSTAVELEERVRPGGAR